MIEERPHVLYRMYDEGGQLLYVGMTMAPSARFAGHRRTKPWWSEIASISLTQYPSRSAAESAEREAIHAEHPLHNQMRYQPRPQRRRAAASSITSVAPAAAVATQGGPDWVAQLEPGGYQKCLDRQRAERADQEKARARWLEEQAGWSQAANHLLALHADRKRAALSDIAQQMRGLQTVRKALGR